MFYRVIQNTKINELSIIYQNKITKFLTVKKYNNLNLNGFCLHIRSADELTAKVQTKKRFQEVLIKEPFYSLKVLTDMFDWNIIEPHFYEQFYGVDYDIKNFEFDYNVTECTVDEVFNNFKFSDVIEEIKNLGIPVLTDLLQNKD